MSWGGRVGGRLGVEGGDLPGLARAGRCAVRGGGEGAGQRLLGSGSRAGLLPSALKHCPTRWLLLPHCDILFSTLPPRWGLWASGKNCHFLLPPATITTLPSLCIWIHPSSSGGIISPVHHHKDWLNLTSVGPFLVAASPCAGSFTQCPFQIVNCPMLGQMTCFP